MAIADLAQALGAAPLTKHAGCWEVQVDSNWFLAVNGHRAPVPTTTLAAAFDVPPFHAYVEWNGWPAAVIHPLAGGPIVAGSLANEDSLIEALRAAAEKALA